MGEIAIQVRNVCKQYRIGQLERYKTLRSAIVDTFAAPLRSLASRDANPANGKSMIWALDDVTFDVHQGEVLGIIGRNGAGKSTLLKILSRITEPTRGSIDLYGRIGSLLEVGTGFHPELTGRENIYLNGAILGMKRVEIERKFDEIVNFSEIEQFLDTPVKFYSSGMYMRLAFSVAAHLEPEILLVDEVLAVGDAEFQKKCLGKMGEVANEGRTVLFVSHNLSAIEHLCTRTILLEQGKIILSGASSTIVKEYLTLMSSSDGLTTKFFPDQQRKKAWIHSLGFYNPANPSSLEVAMAEPFSIEVDFRSQKPMHSPVMTIQFLSLTGQIVFAAYTHESVESVPAMKNTEGKFICHIPANPLAPGRYFISVILGEPGQRVDEQSSGIAFDVLPADIYHTGRFPTPELSGVTWTPHTWEFQWEKETSLKNQDEYSIR